MHYVSLFSGIEAATVAFTPLGWRPLAFSEIDPFPSAVLAHHYPDVPNLGDITQINWTNFRAADTERKRGHTMSIELELTIIEVSIIFLCLALLFHVAACRLHERNRDKESVRVHLEYGSRSWRRISNELARQWGIQSPTFSWYYITDENDKETESEAKE